AAFAQHSVRETTVSSHPGRARSQTADLRRTTVLGTKPPHISLTSRRAADRAAPTAEHHPGHHHRRQPHAHLTNPRPYQSAGADACTAPGSKSRWRISTPDAIA